jgi:hypothetical protein
MHLLHFLLRDGGRAPNIGHQQNENNARPNRADRCQTIQGRVCEGVSRMKSAHELRYTSLAFEVK